MRSNTHTHVSSWVSKSLTMLRLVLFCWGCMHSCRDECRSCPTSVLKKSLCRGSLHLAMSTSMLIKVYAPSILSHHSLACFLSTCPLDALRKYQAKSQAFGILTGNQSLPNQNSCIIELFGVLYLQAGTYSHCEFTTKTNAVNLHLLHFLLQCFLNGISTCSKLVVN